jgi:hypothetical protein
MSAGTEYRVFIRGENYLTASGQLGFYSSRFVVANSREEAMERAVQMIRDDTDLVLRNDPDDSPQIVIEEVTEGWEGYEGIQPGFAYFGEDEPT